LRAKKYVIDNALKAMEKFAIFKSLHQECFAFNGDEYKKSCEILESGVFIPLTRRNADGQKIVICRFWKLDVEKYTPDDMRNAMFLIMSLTLVEEESQIAGLNFIFDLRNMSVMMIEKYLLTCLIKYGGILKSCPMRIKSIVAIGLPSYAVKLIAIIKSVLSEKIRDRGHFHHQSYEDLGKNFDVPMLQEVFDNPKSEAKAIAEVGSLLQQNIERLREFNRINVDLQKMKLTQGDKFDTNIGNFRKLEID
jgi:hypothetical protein